jgi:cysteine desulfurase
MGLPGRRHSARGALTLGIYLDYSATTPIRPEALARWIEVSQHQWGNPSSLHRWGERAALALELARLQVAELIGAQSHEIAFTSGGTEADNWAIQGICQRFCQPQHLIVSSVEHSAVVQPVRWLEQQGWRVSWLPVNRQGRVNPEDLAQALTADTVLLSVIWGQSEVGTLQPIAELGAIARQQGVLFHTDAVQVAGRLPIDVSALPIDLLSLSSHKLYGPQGVGALWIREGVSLEPLLRGGGQEGGWRSGTQPVAAIAGFGVAAACAAAELSKEVERLQNLRDRLFQLLADVPGLIPTGDRQRRLPHHVSFAVLPQVGGPRSGRQLVRELSRAGIAISSGSACSSGQPLPSPVLQAMGYDPATALGALRLTLGHQTNLAEIEQVAAVLRRLLVPRATVNTAK